MVALPPPPSPSHTYFEMGLGLLSDLVGGPVCDDRGCRMAAVVSGERGVRAWVDGQEGPVYDQIERLQFSPGGKHVAYAASGEGWRWRLVLDGVEWGSYDAIGPVTFSDDGERVAFVAQKGRKHVVVVDGHEGPEYDDLREDIVFSPDGGRVAYVARKGRERIAVVDGQDGPAYDDIGTGSPVFSGDGSRVAYHARKDGKWLVVRDGEEGPCYDDILSLVLSHDGEHMAYSARRGHKQVAVIDGREGPRYDVISDLGLLAQGERTAYAALQGTSWRIVTDGQASSPYADAWIADCCFWTDHVAYAAQSRGKWAVYVDGRVTFPCDGIGRNSLVVGWDGQRTAYVARRGAKWFVVVNDEKGPAFDLIWCKTDWRYAARYAVFGERAARVVEARGQVLLQAQAVELDDYHGTRHRWLRHWEMDVTSTGPPVFSTEGKRWGYEARKGSKWVMVLDGQVGQGYDSIGFRTLTFSPDEQHAAYVAARDGRELVVLDGWEGPEYDRIAEHGPFFREDGTLEFLGWRGGQVYHVTVPTESI